MICPICSNEIKDDSKFCPKCGKQIPRCPSCNTVITKKMRFCMNDGTPLPEEIFSVFESNNEEKKQHYCIQCGSPCSENEPLCPKCQQNSIVNSPQKSAPNKKKRILLFMLIVMLAGIAGVLGYVGYSVYSGNITLNFLSKETPASPTAEADSNKGGTIIDRSSTDESESEKSASTLINESETSTAAFIDDLNESSETAAVPSTEETATSQFITESEIAQPLQDFSEISPVDYFILNCDKQYFTIEDLSVFDAEMCRIARNGIYARLGRKFQDEALTNYFMKFEWYIPTINPEDFSDTLLNTYQIANRDLIVAYEHEKGYR